MEGHIFRDEHPAQLDSKGRIGIPVDWRPLLQAGERAFFHAYPSLKSSVDDADTIRCISNERLLRLNEQVQQLPTYDNDRKVIDGLVLSRMKQHNLDTQGRVSMNTDMLKDAGIGNSMVLVGFGDHFQIWNPEALADYRARLVQSVLAGEHPNLQKLRL